MSALYVHTVHDDGMKKRMQAPGSEMGCKPSDRLEAVLNSESYVI